MKSLNALVLLSLLSGAAHAMDPADGNLKTVPTGILEHCYPQVRQLFTYGTEFNSVRRLPNTLGSEGYVMSVRGITTTGVRYEVSFEARLMMGPPFPWSCGEVRGVTLP
jgi:hypothetical protein